MDGLKENKVYAVNRVAVRVVPGKLAYAERNQIAIKENWRKQVAAKPALFDGEIFLASRAIIENGKFSAEFQRSSFATLMFWRVDQSVDRPWHIFGSGVMVSAEGHLIAARQANHGALGGKVYFPAGTIDDTDIFDGQVNYETNMRREVLEETGIDLAAARAEASTYLVTANRSIALFRRYYFDISTAELVGRIENYLAQQEQSELSQIIPISGSNDLDEKSPSYIHAFAKWHFHNAD